MKRRASLLVLVVVLAVAAGAYAQAASVEEGNFTLALPSAWQELSEAQRQAAGITMESPEMQVFFAAENASTAQTMAVFGSTAEAYRNIAGEDLELRTLEAFLAATGNTTVGLQPEDVEGLRTQFLGGRLQEIDGRTYYLATINEIDVLKIASVSTQDGLFVFLFIWDAENATSAAAEDTFMGLLGNVKFADVTEQGSNMTLWIVIGVVAFVLIVLVIALLMRRNGKSRKA